MENNQVLKSFLGEKYFKMKLTVSYNTLSKSMDELRETLLSLINRKDAIRYALAIEEVVEHFLKNSKEDKVNIELFSFFGKVSVRITSTGTQVYEEIIRYSYHLQDDIDDEEYATFVQQLMQRILGNNISINYTRGKNICDFIIADSRYDSLIRALGALLLGIVTGLILKGFAPSALNSVLTENVFSPIFTMFLNALKMIVAPLVFFSLVVSISDYSNPRALGRIAIKTVLFFLASAFMAVYIGYGVYSIFQIGDPALRNVVTNSASTVVENASNTTISLKDMIVNIVPSSFIAPFVNNEMLQLIFMGVLFGLAVGALSKNYPGAKKTINCLNGIFSKIAEMIIQFMPLAVFCSIAQTVISTDLVCFTNVLAWVLVNYVGYFMVILFDLIVLVVLGHLNPMKFLHGFLPAMVTAFSVSSRSAGMSTTLECCEKLGINKKVSALSIPLSMIVHKPGNCITLIISAMFMAKIFGITITIADVGILSVAIVLLSISAPAVPNGGLLTVTLLFTLIGVPENAISLIMGVYTLVGMGEALSSIVGDGVISTIVTKSEKMLNLENYNSN